jgi:hypothetical protein
MSRAPADGGSIVEGSSVVLTGLQQRAELNGEVGVALSFTGGRLVLRPAALTSLQPLLFVALLVLPSSDSSRFSLFIVHSHGWCQMECAPAQWRWKASPSRLSPGCSSSSSSSSSSNHNHNHNLIYTHLRLCSSKAAAGASCMCSGGTFVLLSALYFCNNLGSYAGWSRVQLLGEVAR